MHIGILTFQFASNYGALLQAYALRETLKSIGHEVEIVNYVSDFCRRAYSANPVAHLPDIKSCVSFALRLPHYSSQKSFFDRFRDEELGISSQIICHEAELTEYLTKFDTVVIGSDQVWNPELINGDTTYFADFADHIACVSYAAGIGMSDALTTLQTEKLQRNLRNFKYVSVRENAATALLQTFVSEDVRIAPDPVFLLPPEKWRKLAEAPSELDRHKKYVFYYSLGGKRNPHLTDSTVKCSEKYGLPIVASHPASKKSCISGKQVYKAGPKEFLHMVLNAEIVCSDSFHALAFCALFGKKAFIVPKNPQDSRIVSLIDNLGMDLSEDGFYTFDTCADKAVCERRRGYSIIREMLEAVSTESDL